VASSTAHRQRSVANCAVPRLACVSAAGALVSAERALRGLSHSFTINKMSRQQRVLSQNGRACVFVYAKRAAVVDDGASFKAAGGSLVSAVMKEVCAAARYLRARTACPLPKWKVEQCRSRRHLQLQGAESGQVLGDAHMRMYRACM